jgi:subtilisin family serine protease/fibronectin type 3 domain-containing protein
MSLKRLIVVLLAVNLIFPTGFTALPLSEAYAQTNAQTNLPTSTKSQTFIQTEQQRTANATRQKISGNPNSNSKFSVNKESDYKDGEVIVKLKPSLSQQSINSKLGKFEAKAISKDKHLQLVKLPKGKGLETFLNELSIDPEILNAEPNYLLKMEYTPNDTFYSSQWYLPKINVPQAWDVTQGTAGATVAIIDGGVDVTHPDLKDNIISPYNAVNGTTTLVADDHGTHVAGIVAAAINNGAGIAGVAPKTEIMPIDVFNGAALASISDIASGIYYAADHGAKIINMSLGSQTYSEALETAVNYAYSKGVLLVAAAGNNGTSTPVYPAAFNNVISVSASNSSDQITSWSSFGAYIDIAAPGEDIYSTTPSNTYSYGSGTSMASPVVAGVAALVLAKDYSLTNNQVKSILFTSTQDLGSSGWDSYYGYGRVDAGKALGLTNTAVGDRATPYSAWDNHRFTFQEYSWDNPKVVETQLMDIYTGEDANYIIEQENMFNAVPAYDEEWILMGFNLKYISGPEEPLYASDVIGSVKSYFTTTGQNINPIATAAFSNQLYGYGEYDVQLYPGSESPVWYGILVKKTVGFPLVRIGTGYNNSTYQTIYKWFSTDPYYYVPVTAPTGLTATGLTKSQINLNWTAVSGVTSYKVYRATSQTGTYSYVGTVGTNLYSDSGLSANTSYWYRVSSVNTTGEGAPSVVVSGKTLTASTIAAPTGLTATGVSKGQINLNWTAVTGATKYIIYRATSQTGTYSYVGTSTTNAYSNAWLGANTTYWYKVSAVDSTGEGSQAATISGKTLAASTIAAPTGLTATGVSKGQINLNWTAVTGATKYIIYRATSQTGTYSYVGTSTTNAYSNAWLGANTTYWYKVSSVNTTGEGAPSVVVSGKTLAASTIAAPTGLTATGVSKSQINLKWTAVTGTTKYNIYRATSQTGTYSYVGSSTTNAYSNASLGANTTYWYKVSAVDSTGEGSQTTAVSTKTLL